MKKFTRYPKSILAADDPDVFVLDGKSAVPKDVKKVRIQDGVRHIRKEAFYARKSLVDVYIPDSVTSIGSYAFLGCSSLKHINIPNSVTTIHPEALERCSFVSIELPNALSAISIGVLAGCSFLESIVIPEGVTAIKDFAFLDCVNLRSVEIPDSVVTIGKDAFKNCHVLENIVIPEHTKVHSTAFNGTPLEAQYKKDVDGPVRNWCYRRVKEYYGDDLDIDPANYRAAANAWADFLKADGDPAYGYCRYWSRRDSLNEWSVPEDVYDSIVYDGYPDCYAEEAMQEFINV